MAGIILQVLAAELAGVAVLAGVFYAIWSKATKKSEVEEASDLAA